MTADSAKPTECLEAQHQRVLPPTHQWLSKDAPVSRQFSGSAASAPMRSSAAASPLRQSLGFRYIQVKRNWREEGVAPERGAFPFTPPAAPELAPRVVEQMKSVFQAIQAEGIAILFIEQNVRLTLSWRK
jgi:hypothetical protein